MKNKLKTITVLIGFLFFTPGAIAQGEAEAPDLGAIVADYLVAWAAINQLDTDKDDIKHYDSFFTSDISYEIPEFDMVFQGDDFLGSEVEGSGRVRNSDYSVAEIIVGKGVVFVKLSLSSERLSADAEWKKLSGSDFMVFEFKGDKIKRVIDY